MKAKVIEANPITRILSGNKTTMQKKEDFCLAEVNLEEEEGARGKRLSLSFHSV